MYSHPQNLHSSDFIELASWNHEITRVNSWFQLYRVNFLLFPWQKWRWIRIFLINHFCCKRMFPHRKMPLLYATLSQPHAELIKRSLTGSDISKYNKSWPHVTSSISEWKKPSGKVELLIISVFPQPCHRSAHRGFTWFLLSRCKDRKYFR